MYQTKIRRCQCAPLWLWVYTEVRERKLSRLSPDLDGGLDLRRPEKIGLLRRLGTFWHHGSRTIHVIATDLMFGTIAAG
jgi:hypothetical protein